MFEFKTKLGEGGKIVIPAEYRQALNLHVGDDIILQINEIHVLTHYQAIQQARALIPPYISPGRSLSEELIRERHHEQ